MINKLYSILALLMFSGLVNAFTVTVYESRVAWENALPSGSAIITEDFDDEIMAPGLASYTTADGTSSIFRDFNLIPSTASEPTFNGTQVFEELVNGVDDTIWSFSSPFIAFGGNWDLFTPGGPGTGIQISIDGQIQNNVLIPNSHTGEFWGFVADSAFLEVRLLKRTAVSGVEQYHLDDMVYANVVPLPAAAWFFVSGFIGLLGYKKRFSH